MKKIIYLVMLLSICMSVNLYARTKIEELGIEHPEIKQPGVISLEFNKDLTDEMSQLLEEEATKEREKIAPKGYYPDERSLDDFVCEHVDACRNWALGQADKSKYFKIIKTIIKDISTQKVYSSKSKEETVYSTYTLVVVYERGDKYIHKKKFQCQDKHIGSLPVFRTCK